MLPLFSTRAAETEVVAGWHGTVWHGRVCFGHIARVRQRRRWWPQQSNRATEPDRDNKRREREKEETRELENEGKRERKNELERKRKREKGRKGESEKERNRKREKQRKKGTTRHTWTARQGRGEA